MKRSILISAAIVLASFASPALALPEWRAQPDRASATSGWYEVQRRISPQEARAIALSRVPGGEVVDIRTTADAYRVRIIARDGRVIDIVVDARTGRIR